MLEHGGQLHAAAQRYGIPVSDWLDLSTGINPLGWPVPDIPARIWTRLPEDDDGLADAAREYYGARHVLPVAGSQAAIRAIPKLRACSHVAVIAPGYNEHAHAWRNAGHEVVLLASDEFIARAAGYDVAVLIHPNNPTGSRYSREELLHLHGRLRERGGCLLIDEAFMDASPEHSLAPLAHEPGLIVLRSLGKFFGLAGARVGFAFAEVQLLAHLREQLGPWSVAGPSRWIALHALRDRAWHDSTRATLAAAQSRLARLLTEHGLAPRGGCALFQWTHHTRAAALHEHFARRAILTRPFPDPASLRFGLPACEEDWNRLRGALREIAS